MRFKIKWYEENKEWSYFDHALVQILVVVATSQVRTLIADVRKVFDAIVVSIELADLKTSPKGTIRKNSSILAFPDSWKGNKLIFLCMVRVDGRCSNIITVDPSGYEKAT